MRQRVGSFFCNSFSIPLNLRLTHPSDYKDDGTNILLDANENAYGPGLAVDSSSGKLQNASLNGETSVEVDLLGLNRYPDPYIPSLFSHL